MRKIIKKYFITTIAILMSGSIAYASSCANFCTPKDMSVGSMNHTMSGDMVGPSDMTDPIAKSMDNANGCDSKSESNSHHSDGTNSAASCDGEYVVSTKTLKLKPLITDSIIFSTSLVRETFKIESGLVSNSAVEMPYLTSAPLFIQNSTFLI